MSSSPGRAGGVTRIGGVARGGAQSGTQPGSGARPGAPGVPGAVNPAGQPDAMTLIARAARTRGPSARDLLRIDWKFPVFEAEIPGTGRSLARKQRQVLSLEEAVARVAGDDHRPLLILRECLTCSGTDDALLSRSEDNEKTILMSHWFHCVKLPPDVLHEDHPFRSLFADEDPPHLFVARADGSGRKILWGDQSRTELWDVMGSLLESEYAKSYDRSLRELMKLLDRSDVVDARLSQLQDRIEETIERHGPKSSRLKKLRAEQARSLREREELDEAFHEVAKIGLEPSFPLPAAVASDSEG